MPRKRKVLTSPERIKEDTIKVFSPKKANLKRNLTKDELIKLCKYSKCYVDMSKWNAVNEFYWQLKRKGKLVNKSQRQINKLLVKLANRYKDDPNRSYSNGEIKKTRDCMWKLRKSWNVEWLDNNNDVIIAETSNRHVSNESFATIITQISTKSRSISSNKPPSYMDGLFYDPSLVIGAEEIVDSQTPDHTESSFADNNNNNNTEEENSLAKLGAAVIEIINTESIPNILTQSEHTILFDNASDNYESFHVSVPITSTQSQEQR